MRKYFLFILTSLTCSVSTAFAVPPPGAAPDLHRILGIAALPLQSSNIAWHNAASFAEFYDNHHEDVSAAAKACELRSGAFVKSVLDAQFSFHFGDKDALHRLFNTALSDNRLYQACRIEPIELDRPSAPDVIGHSFVYTIIDATAQKEVVLGLYTEYY